MSRTSRGLAAFALGLLFVGAVSVEAHCGTCGIGEAKANKDCCKENPKKECCKPGQEKECCKKGAAPAAAPAADAAAAPAAAPADAAAAPAAAPADAAPAPAPAAEGDKPQADRGQLSPGMQKLMDKVDELRRRRAQR